MLPSPEASEEVTDLSQGDAFLSSQSVSLSTLRVYLIRKSLSTHFLNFLFFLCYALAISSNRDRLYKYTIRNLSVQAKPCINIAKTACNPFQEIQSCCGSRNERKLLTNRLYPFPASASVPHPADSRDRNFGGPFRPVCE